MDRISALRSQLRDLEEAEGKLDDLVTLLLDNPELFRPYDGAMVRVYRDGQVIRVDTGDFSVLSGDFEITITKRDSDPYYLPEDERDDVR